MDRTKTYQASPQKKKRKKHIKKRKKEMLTNTPASKVISLGTILKIFYWKLIK